MLDPRDKTHRSRPPPRASFMLMSLTLFGYTKRTIVLRPMCDSSIALTVAKGQQERYLSSQRFFRAPRAIANWRTGRDGCYITSIPCIGQQPGLDYVMDRDQLQFFRQLGACGGLRPSFPQAAIIVSHIREAPAASVTVVPSVRRPKPIMHPLLYQGGETDRRLYMCLAASQPASQTSYP